MPLTVGEVATSVETPTVVYAAAAVVVYGFVLQPLFFPSHPLPAVSLDAARDLVFGILGVYTAGRSAEKVTSLIQAGKK